MTGEELTGRARERWNEIDREGLDWRSFINGWWEGRLDLIDSLERRNALKELIKNDEENGLYDD